MCNSSDFDTRPAQTRARILCADDSEEILETCRIMLEAGGYQVFTAGSAAEALGFLKLHRVDAAVIDNIMPDMTGVNLAREIKSSAPGSLVVLYSGTLRADETFPYVDACLSKGQGPLALRELLGLLLQR